MPETLRYEAIQHICWEVSGKDLNPDKVNPIIHDFHTRLDDFHYKKPPFIIIPTAIDEFEIQEVSDSLLIGSHQIRWEIIDTNFEGAISRKNNEVRPLLTREMMKIQVKGNIRGSRRIVIRIVNTRFQGEFKEGEWPDFKLQNIAL